MSLYSSTRIPKPSDPIAFQGMAKILFQEVLKDPSVREYGRQGQKQRGIDLIGRRKPDLKHWVGIQCKLTGKDNLNPTIIRKEAEEALKIFPPLKELIFFTTADDCAKLDDEARKITDEQADLGRDFEVSVWGWGNACTEIVQYERALQAFFPDGSPLVNHIVKSVDRLTEQTEEHHTSISLRIDRIDEGQAKIISSMENSGFNSVLDNQIDNIRQMITADKLIDALGLLEAMQLSLPNGTDKRVRFRIKANIASCHLRLGDHVKAAAFYADAFNISPEEEKADAFKVLSLVLEGKNRDAYLFGQKMLPQTKNRKALVCNMVTALRQESDIAVIDDLLEDTDRDSIEVIIAEIDYYRAIGNRTDWRDLAISSYQRFPSDDILERYDAEARMDRILETFDADRTVPPSQNALNDMHQIASVLERGWGKRLTTDCAFDDYHLSLCVNLITAYRFLSNYNAAISLIDLALQNVPDDQKLIEQAFSYTVYAANVLGILPLLRLQFKRVIVARSTVDEIISMRQQLESQANYEFMTMRYHKGQFFRENVTSEMVVSDIEKLNALLENIKQYTEVLVPMQDDVNEPLRVTVAEMAGAEIFDPARIANENNMLLLSEDLHYRQLSMQIYGSEGTWLQATVNHLYNKKNITQFQYVDATVGLALFRHSYLSVDASTLLEILRIPHNSMIERFKSAAGFIGGKNSEFKSNLRVGLEFILSAWDVSDVERLTRMQAISIMLYRLMLLGSQHNVKQDVINFLKQSFSSRFELLSYFNDWLVGHFIET